MSYEMLDPILERWAREHNLHVSTIYKDEEVRSIGVVSPHGKSFQLWLDEPEGNGRTVVHVWDYRKRRCDFAAGMSDFESQLERGYSEIKSWF